MFSGWNTRLSGSSSRSARRGVRRSCELLMLAGLFLSFDVVADETGAVEQSCDINELTISIVDPQLPSLGGSPVIQGCEEFDLWVSARKSFLSGYLLQVKRGGEWHPKFVDDCRRMFGGKTVPVGWAPGRMVGSRPSSFHFVASEVAAEYFVLAPGEYRWTILISTSDLKDGYVAECGWINSPSFQLQDVHVVPTTWGEPNLPNVHTRRFEDHPYFDFHPQRW